MTKSTSLVGVRKFFILILVITTFFFHSCYASSNNSWPFLSTTTIKADQFLEKYPQFDGRGVVILICDTGVDVGVPGLLRTSTGETKIIDVQDFSGEGDVLLSPGEIKQDGDEHYILHPDGFKLYHYDKLQQKPIDNDYLIGYLDESKLRNSKIKDLNNNGQIDDVFGILVFETEDGDDGYWVAFVDTDGDGHIDDEKPIRNYRENFDIFQLRSPDKLKDQTLLNFALSIEPELTLEKVSVYFDDSGHGTHVAGIAAGFRINDQDGYNGIAPGAKIISLKIGNNLYKGGCTVNESMKKAINYGINYAEQHNVPLIFNFSYGIESVIEGRSDIDQLINDTISDFPRILFVLSNGNEGPGISSIGSPAAAAKALSVGAMLPRELARDCLGTNLLNDKIYYFSSRGGEIMKPDVITPGLAISAVPPFKDRDLMDGSSMAAPHAAGAAALLMSAVAQTHSPKDCKGLLIKRTLKYSASPIPAYSHLDQGTGVIDVTKAYELLKTYLQRNEQNLLLDYDIETESPRFNDHIGQTAYWRTAGYFPQGDQCQTFHVYPIFPDSLKADDRAKFYRAYELKASHAWLTPEKKYVYLKGDNQIDIKVNYNADLLKTPGLYPGKITAFRKGSNQKEIEFELLTTIIIPHYFNFPNHYTHDFGTQKLAPGDLQRYFVQIPPGATAAEIKVKTLKNRFCKTRIYLCDPDGHQYDSSLWIKSEDEDEDVLSIPQVDLQTGTWEIVAYADMQTNQASFFDLSLSFYSFTIEPPLITDFDYETGQEPEGNFKVINNFNKLFNGFARGKILGYQKTITKDVRNHHTFRRNFSVNDDIEKIIFDFQFPDEIFIKFTDVAINIFDEDDKAVVRESMGYKNKKVLFDDPFPGNYMLEIKAALTYGTISETWQFSLKEQYFTTEVINVAVFKDDERLFKIYPNIAEELKFKLSNSPRIAPDGFSIFGTIDFIDRHLLNTTFSIPIEFPPR